MKKVFTKEWFHAASIRAIKTVAQSLVGMIPVGFMITPDMIQKADWTIAYVILAWLGTGLFAGATSFLTSLAGLPEVDQ